jgi:PBP1b-binding outer membrane lipoprotein LpoB
MTVQGERPASTGDDEKQMGMVQMLLHDMPPWQKSILSFFMIVPLALALSGLVLQVNVGSIIQALINEQLTRSREQTVGTITTSLNESTASLSEQISGLQQEALATSNRLDRLEERTNDMVTLSVSRIDKLETRAEELSKSINDIKVYICDTDQQLRGDCALLR